MRKLIRAVALVTMAATTLSLPAEAQSKNFIGIIAGVDFSSFTGSLSSAFYIVDESGSEADFYDQQSTTGFIGGIFVDLPIGQSLILEPSLLFAQKGADYNVDIYDSFGDFVGSGRLTGNLDYLSVPLLLRYNFQADGGVYGLIGPEVSFNLSCTLKGAGGSIDCSDDLGLEPTTTFGGVAGLGYQKGPVGIEGRYDFDFGNAFSNVDGLKNSAWELMLRYQFR